MRRYHETFRLWEYLLFAVVTLAVLCLCVCIGSVRVPLGDTLAFFAAKLTGGALPEGLVSSIMPIRLPRVLCVALTGAALSLAGAAMQGLLKNPLADGSTLGVSSGASEAQENVRLTASAVSRSGIFRLIFSFLAGEFSVEYFHQCREIVYTVIEAVPAERGECALVLAVYSAVAVHVAEIRYRGARVG